MNNLNIRPSPSDPSLPGNSSILQQINEGFALVDADHAKLAEFARKKALLDEQATEFRPSVLAARMDAAFAAYEAEPTIENLYAAESAMQVRHNRIYSRSLLNFRVRATIADARKKIHLLEIVPWQRDVLARFLPGAREYLNELIAEEKEHAKEMLGGDAGLGPVGAAAEHLLQRFARLEMNLGTEELAPAAFLAVLGVVVPGVAQTEQVSDGE